MLLQFVSHADEERMNNVAISLGSNINPLIHLESAWEALQKILEKPRLSSIYLTKPMDFINQPPYLNCAVTGHYHQCAPSLLLHCQAIENNNQRKRSHHQNESRTLDLDILLFNDAIIHTSQLTIPHPGLCQRDFMLIPLLELQPDTIHPKTQTKLLDYKEKLAINHIVQKWKTLSCAEVL